MNRLEKQLVGFKNRLLDLSKRNKLINFVPRKRSQLEILYPNLETILDNLDSKMRIKSIFFNTKENPFDLAYEYEKAGITKDRTITLFDETITLKDTYSKKELERFITPYFAKYKNEKDTILTTSRTNITYQSLSYLQKRAKLFKEENAINILYLAVGFLKWIETKEERYSPLMLIPVKIKQSRFTDPFVLDLTDSEIILNESLIKKMDLTYQLDFSYQLDEKKQDLEKYLEYKEYISNLIKNSDWKISDDIYLSTFTFSQMQIYNDLERNHDKVIKSPLIRAIALNDDSELKANFFQTTDINPKDFYQVLDADSSQQLAIQSAINGNSFVLQGPPGTGKSQTITNIITELIARGKKVLFVAEKQAALNVVYRHLEKSGLKSFVLPLHDDSVQKQELIKTLHDELVIRQQIPKVNKYDELIRDYQLNQESLSKYAKSLIVSRKSLNESLFDTYENYFKYYEAIDLKFDFDIKDIDKDELKRILVDIKAYENYHNEIKDVKNHPFYGLKNIDFDLLEKEKFEELLDKLKLNINALEDTLKNTPVSIANSSNLQDLVNLLEFYNHLLIDHEVSEELFEIDETKILKLIKEYGKLIEFNKNFLEKQKEISDLYDLKILENDVNEYLNTLADANFFTKLFSKKYKKVKKDIINFRKDKTFKTDDIIIELEKVKAFVETSKLADANNKLAGIKNPEAYLSNLNWLYEYKKLAVKYKLTKLGFNDINSIKKAELKKTFKKLTTINKKLDEILDKVKEYFYHSKKAIETLSFGNLKTLANANVSLAIEYLRFQESYQNKKLKSFFDLLEKNSIQSGYVDIFLKRFYLLVINQIYSYDPTLKNFNKNLFTRYKSEFIESEKKLISLSSYKIKELITLSTPDIKGIQSSNQEMLVLRREAAKERKIMPLRQLFMSIPNLIKQLKPVIMMSPLSVSSYLKDEDFQFDTVIFDEASQIRPENALGAIYRAKQAIIVGDNEQLPPTDFFRELDVTSDESLDFDAYLSILDIARSVLDTYQLNWHYRSLSESLIHISNKHIYENKLLTFPTPKMDNKGLGLHFVKTNGRFKRGANGGFNLIEANKVVDLVFNHFDLYQDKKTLGVVTFNIEQQLKIEGLIYDRRRENPQYEKYFNTNQDTNFFVKNIETVQGDERDTIILSIGYGYDENDKMILNFGPLNKEKGYRRLNVAITRAKQEMICCSSISSADLRLNENHSKGLHLLKNFIHYAEHKEDLVRYHEDTKDSIILSVVKIINECGYQCDLNIGSSYAKIDIAIKSNVNKEYLGAIILDGTKYQALKTTRERERLYEEVLTIRGFKIYNLYVIDWLNHHLREEESLRQFVSELKERPIDKSNKELSSSVVTDVIAKTADTKNNLIDDSFEIVNDNNSDDSRIKEDIILTFEDKKQVDINFNSYPSYEKIYDRYKVLATQQVILEMIKETAPIHIEEAYKIALKVYQKDKISNYLKDTFKNDIDALIKRGVIVSQNDFYLYPNKKITFRKHDIGEKRELMHIHNNEYEHGIMEILKVIKETTLDELVFRIVNYLGCDKVLDNYKNRIMRSIDLLTIKEKIKLSDNIVSIT